MDGEIVRVRLNEEGDRWHGWLPNAYGAEPLVKDEPMVAVVHSIVRPGQLVGFARNNLRAASRAAHHPRPPRPCGRLVPLSFELTSVSLWKTYASPRTSLTSRADTLMR